MRENYLDLPAFCAGMKEAGMAAVVAASPNAVFHTSGCLIITHNPIRDRLAFCVTTAEGRQCLVVCTIETSLCEHDSWVRDIRGYVEFKKLPTHLLAETLADLGLAGKTVGIDLEYLREHYFRELKAAAPSTNFVSADALLGKLQAIKKIELVGHMRYAAQQTQAAIAAVLDENVVGLTESQVRLKLRKALADRGADGSYLVVATGPNIGVPEHRATGQVIEKGQPLTLDAAATFDGYVAEAAVSTVAGENSKAQAQTALDQIYRAAGAALRTGARARDVFAAAEGAARDAGGKLIGSWVGYGVTYGGKEPPFLASSSNATVARGMTIALDVGYEDPSGMLLRKKGVWFVDDHSTSELAAAS